VAELKQALPIRNNEAGLERGYYTKPVPAGFPGGACPSGGCPPNWISSDDPKLVGFDRDFIELVFTKMLNLPYMFSSFGGFTDMFLGLLQGYCDVVITASEIDPVDALCDGPPQITDNVTITYDYGNGDYHGSTEDSVLNTISCLEYGTPYLYSGFALMSLISTKPFDISNSVFNNDMLNAFSVIVLISMTCGYLASMLERKNMHLGTVSRGAYWSIMNFLANSENEPVRKKGRTLMIIMMCANMLGMQVIGAIMGAKLTTTALTVVKIDKLSDVSGALCVERFYPVLNKYVEQQPDRPKTIVYDSTEGCVAKLMAKEVVAVMTDATQLTWLASHAQLSGVYVTPVLQANPFAFVYSNYSLGLQQYLNPAVSAATVTDMEWIQFTEGLQGRYFGVQEVTESSEDNPIHKPSAIAALILLVFPLLMALLNGDLGPGIFKNAESGWKYRIRKLISQPSAKEDAMFMSDKEGALQGHDLSFFRFAVTKLEEIRGEMAMNRGAASELLNLTAPPDALLKAASKGSASNDVASVLATMLGPVLQELRVQAAVQTDMQQMLAQMQHMLDALHKQQHSQGGGSAGCFGGGAKPA
jgi:ABC-type amino acid transport substrate-binding protein